MKPAGEENGGVTRGKDSPDILALHFSPRRGGNSDDMLAEFIRGAAAAGAEVFRFSVAERRVEPCQGCGLCEASGQCFISDDMEELYPLLASVANIVLATPIYFYGLPAAGKALVDRAQPLWVRRRLNRTETLRPGARGFLLALGGTNGRDLFTPAILTAKYFFDALGFPKTFETLGFRQVDALGDLRQDPERTRRAYEAGLAFGRAARGER